MTEHIHSSALEIQRLARLTRSLVEATASTIDEAFTNPSRENLCRANDFVEIAAIFASQIEDIGEKIEIASDSIGKEAGHA